ncbi:cyanoexosortase A [Fortiea contorta]|uniref:cyanoexosortase A n=1 Tax=Fortiea contorta TaxID=1892405 RepID=UPI000346AF67|nr:cyanoexosortase A [Fortiea contorta]
MKEISLNSLKRKPTQFLLLAIATALIVIHLAIVWKSKDLSLFFNSVLFLMAISSIIWEKRFNLNLHSEIFSSFFGISLILLISLRVAFIPPSLDNIWFSCFPFISALGLALLASGVKGLKQYKNELLALFFLAAPRIFMLLLAPIFDISIFTAKFVNLILWYTGSDVIRSGLTISFPKLGKGIEVYSACSGIEQIIQILGISILFISMFPIKKQQKIIAPIVAITLAFIVNAMRVALMAIFVASGDQKLFSYWHDGEGSQLFPVVSVLLFGCFCWFFFLRNEQEKQDYTQI